LKIKSLRQIFNTYHTDHKKVSIMLGKTLWRPTKLGEVGF
jgi:hypothetical protein